MSKNIYELFTSWGKEKRQLPERNEVLRNNILSETPSPAEALAKAGQKRKMPWLSFAFAGLAAVMLMINATPSPRTATAPMEAESSLSFREQPVGMDSTKSIVNPDYYPMPTPNGNITDIREFLKTSYNATMRTRNVSNLSQQIRNIIKGVDGRVDGMNISEKNGYISFAVPASKFDAFQSQIKGLVRARFIVENISSQNLLSQKQSLEERQQQIKNRIASLRSQRSVLQAQLQKSTDEQEQKTLTQKIASLNSQISSATATLGQVNKEDTKLLNNVATVNGYISLEWIGVWEIINLYAGPYWLPILLALAAVIAYVNNRRQRLMLPL